MYNSDKPIENSKEDVLGRSFFAEQLAKAILAFDSKDNFTIGLYGKWGSGKTSIINMVIEEIKNQRENGSDSNIPIIVQFSPWNFSDTNQLINQFFRHLRNSLNIKSKNIIGEKVGEALEEYAGAFDYIDAVPVIGQFAKILKITADFTGKQLKSEFSNIDILAVKEKLIKSLKEQDKKILVIIDDIDRLSNEQIKLIFQLVNSVAGFPNIIYLLSMDKEVVIRALESVQNCNGAEYLEKVIQLPFDIPQLDKSKVFELLFRKLNNILKNKVGINVENTHFQKVFSECIEPFVKNVRDVNRIANTFQFKYNMVYNEVNFSDMLGLTTLQVLVPNIVQWIYINQEKICGGITDNVGISLAEQKKRKAEYLKTFEEVCSAPSENVLSAICSLFPRVAKEVSIMYENISDYKLRHDQRIADPEKFKIYFNLNISQIGVSRELMNRSIYKLEKNDICKLIDDLNKNGNIINYLRELRGYIGDIPINKISMFIKILYKKRNTLNENIRKSFVTFSVKIYCDLCIKLLMERIECENDRFSIYKYMLSNIDLNKLETMAEEINRIELSFGRLAAKDKNLGKKEQILTLDHLLELERLFVNSIKTLNKNNSILNCDSLLMIIYLWENFDENGCKEYMDNILKEKFNKIKFITKQSCEWNGTDGRGWTFYEKDYVKYVSKEEVISAINELKYTKEFMELNGLEQLKAAAFILSQNKGYLDNVSETEASKLVKKWNEERMYNSK